MATIKQRVHRMNSSGSYDTIYYETHADCVVAADGNSLSNHLAGMYSRIENVEDNKADSSHNHAAGDITSGTLGVARGGTGGTTLTSGAALIGNGTSAVTTRSITNNTATTTAITGSTNLVTMNTLRYALNRTTGPGTADTNYTTAMMRAIQASTTDLTAGTSSLTSGQIYLVYE